MKNLFLSLICSVLFLGLASCSNKIATEEVTLVVWSSSPTETEALNNTIASFEKETGIKIKVEVIIDKYMDVMKARFAGNNAPDVFYLDSFEAPSLIASDVLEPLTNSIKEQEDIYPQYLDAFSNDGVIYGVPKDFSTLAMYVNTDILSEAGYKVEDIPTDIVGFMDFIKELQTKLPKDVYSFVAEKDLARHLSALETGGNEIISSEGIPNFSSQDSLDLLNYYVQGHKDGYIVSAIDDLGAGWAGEAFGSGKVAIMFEGNWVLSALAKDYPNVNFSSAELPTVNDEKQTMAFTVGYAVSKNSKNKENAIKFVDYMTSDKGLTQWTEESGTLPTRKSVVKSRELENDPLQKAHVLGGEYATVWSRGTTLPIINTNFGNEFLSAFNGSKLLFEAMEDAKKASIREIENSK